MPAKPEPARPGIDALLARRDLLRQRREALVVARRAEEAEAAGFAVVMQAVAQARRDRDTGASTRMQRHRVAFEQIMGDVEAAALMIARVGHRITGLQIAEDDPVRQRAERAAQRGLRALQRLSDDLRAAVDVDQVAPCVGTDAGARSEGGR